MEKYFTEIEQECGATASDAIVKICDCMVVTVPTE